VINIVGALVSPEVTHGMIEAPATTCFCGRGDLAGRIFRNQGSTMWDCGYHSPMKKWGETHEDPWCFALFVTVLVLCLASPAGPQDSFPVKAIRMAVPYPLGGASDVTARLRGQKMSEACSNTCAPIPGSSTTETAATVRRTASVWN